jgi:hypothetical protein
MTFALQPVPNLPGLTVYETRNPADMAFPPMLAMELAMKIDTPANICAAYGLTRGEFAQLVRHPVFIKAYQEAVESLKVDGMSFKVKARMQAESYLDTAWTMARNPGTSDAVRADIIKNTVRWAGYDAKAAELGAGNGGFNIQINLG